MFDQPVLFTNSACEHASVAVMYCREALLEHGHAREAAKLEGIDVCSPAMAALALHILGTIHAPGVCDEYLASARHLCKRASIDNPRIAA